MTHLRKMMLEELKRRNYAQTITSSYVQTTEDFARYLQAPSRSTGSRAHPGVPNVSVPREEARSTNGNPRLAALRFFFIQTLKKPWLERSRNTVPQEGATPSEHLESRRSSPSH